MASSNSPKVNMEPPLKRRKISPTPPSPRTSATIAQTAGRGIAGSSSTHTQTVMSDSDFQPDREAEVGILYFVNTSNVGFTGVLKQRYTDFLVNEIAPDGSVVHLTDDKAPNERAIAKKQELVNSGGKLKAEDESAQGNQEPRTESNKWQQEEEKQQNKQEEIPQTHRGKLDKVETAAKEPNPATRSTEPTPHSSSNGAAPITFMIAPGDEELLVNYFGAVLKDDIIRLYEKILAKPSAKPAVFGALFTESITDRPLRGRLHRDVRRIFAGRLETEVVGDDGIIKITAAPPIKVHPDGQHRNQSPRQQSQSNQLRGKIGWQELGGEFLHFSLYKENKDTMEVISFLARMLRIKPKDFSFSGTKDRRAVTVQRVSVQRKHAAELAKLNRDLRMARIGDFKHEKQRLELGENDGNQFIITLRDCHFGDDAGLNHVKRVMLGHEVVGKAVQYLQAHGFINYYGLQRFGTFGIGTDEVGKKILMDDFEGAIDAILSYSEDSLAAALNPGASRPNDKISRDDVDRAHAIHIFKTSGNGHLALEKMPNKFSGEKAIIQYLSSKGRGSDYVGALLAINRNLRTMYVHAYQSLVWNTAASVRWARYGDKVIQGDLILVDTQAVKVSEHQDVDESGEVVVRPAVEDFAVTHDDIYQRARRLTSEEAESGNYTVFDIVLPTPGFDVEYPDNDIGDFYKEFMASTRGGGVDPGNMRRKHKDFSLSGNYRKFVGQVGKDMSFEIKTYVHENEQLVETDLEKLNKSRPQQDRAYHEGNTRRQGNGWSSSKEVGHSKNWIERNRDEQNTRGEDHNNRFSNPKDKHKLDSNVERLPRINQSASEITPQLSAWMNLPEKLAAEDKAHAQAVELAKLTAEPIKPDNIKQPIYKETFIETSVDDEGRRTGRRSHKYIDVDGKEISKAEAEFKSNSTSEVAEIDSPQNNTSVAAVSINSTAMDIDSAPASLSQLNDISKPMFRDGASEMPNLSSSFSNSDNSQDDQDGGVRLNPPASPKKLPAGEISISTTQPLNPAAAKYLSPAQIENVDKKETSVEGASISISPQLNSDASEFVTSLKTKAAVTTEEPSSSLDLAEAQEPEVKIAVIIKFVLGTSQYATIALRELMKSGGLKTYKPDFSSGR